MQYHLQQLVATARKKMVLVVMENGSLLRGRFKKKKDGTHHVGPWSIDGNKIKKWIFFKETK